MKSVIYTDGKTVTTSYATAIEWGIENTATLVEHSVIPSKEVKDLAMKRREARGWK